MAKITQAIKRDFHGGEPLFKNINGASGMREIRMFAYSGGAIRVLFKHIRENQQALLLGFIKKSDSEGYESAITEANRIYSSIERA